MKVFTCKYLNKKLTVTYMKNVADIPIKHQVIENAGKPLFVLVPYEEYLAAFGPGTEEEAALPLEVSKIANLDDKSLIRAWREYLGLSQADVAERMEISRSAYAQMEEKSARPRVATLRKIAAALGVEWRQLLKEE